MIIVRMQGGLGNQLFQYATAYALSQRTESPFRIDKTLFDRKIETRKFQLDNFITEFVIVNKLVVRLLTSERTKKITAHPFLNLYHKTVEDPIWEKISFSGDDKKIYLTGYWGFPEYFIHHLEDFRKKFRLRENLMTEEFVSVKKLIESRNCISVHIRRGDYLAKENTGLFCTLSADYFQRAIEAMKERVVNPTFVVFSDDVAWVRQNVVLPQNTFFVEDFGVTEDYLEFDLMRRCQHNIISNSTFSWWAALLNENDNKCVIQPAKWYNDPVAQQAYETRRLLHVEGAIYL